MPFTKYFDGDLPTYVDFYFRGTGFKLARVHMRDRPDSILVDVSAFSKNKSQLNFQTIALRNQFPGELKPFKITPEIIHAGLNSRLSKKVPIKLVSQITFRQRFKPHGMVVLEPESVEIAGPKSLLEKISEVKTSLLKLDDVTGHKEGKLSLEKSSFLGLVSSTSEVKYHLLVEEFTEGIIDVPVELPVSQKSTVTLIPNTVRITYSAPLSYFREIKSTDFAVIAELPFGEMPSKLEVKLRSKPANAQLLTIEPEFVDYIVSK